MNNNLNHGFFFFFFQISIMIQHCSTLFKQAVLNCMQCSADQNLGVYTSGDDEGILPVSGTCYFFDAEACKRNMKFFVVVNWEIYWAASL